MCELLHTGDPFWSRFDQIDTRLHRIGKKLNPLARGTAATSSSLTRIGSRLWGNGRCAQNSSVRMGLPALTPI